MVSDLTRAAERGQSATNMDTDIHSDQDDNSFNLLNSSFDSMSDAGDAFGIGRDDAMFSPSKRTGTAGEECSLTPTTKTSRSNNDDLSMGEISPIKLIYNSDASAGSHFASQVKPSDSRDSVVPPDWRNELGRSAPFSLRSNPESVLQSVRASFLGIKYLLPCLKKSQTPNQCSESNEESDVDAKIAIRRIEAAICAFGGSITKSKRQQQWSIFRPKGAGSEARQKYEAELHQRYLLGAAEITWEVEEEPPIVVGQITSSPVARKSTTAQGKMQSKATKSFTEANRDGGSISDESDSGENRGVGNGTKMKYRCKQCGQLKQNHVCPYSRSLQRSIGVMVFPAVNSYTAAEPGTVAAPLTKMNNFVSYDSDQASPQPDYSARPSGRLATSIVGYPNAITSESLEGEDFYHSPQSSLSAPSSDDQMSQPHVLQKCQSSASGGKRSYCQMIDPRHDTPTYTPRPPFVETVSLRPEHYRAVTPMSASSSTSKQKGDAVPTTASTAYQYSPIPLTFHERKRLSDTLFHLSNQVPILLHECAIVLREARQRFEWDLAVAELLTQVVVGMYCGEGDSRLDGLQQYLLALGISC